MMSPTYRWSIIYLVLALFLTTAFSVPTTAQTLVVAKKGARFSSIQEAIDAAEPGDTIRVKEGTYEENLAIDKDLTLKGAETFEVEVDGQKKGYPVLSIGPSKIEVTVRSLTLMGAEGDKCKFPEKGICPVGLSATGKSEVKIKSITAKRNSLGMAGEGAARATVTDSLIMRNRGSGIRLVESAKVSITGTKVKGNGVHGIGLWNSVEVTIKEGEISGNGSSGLALSHAAKATVQGGEISDNEYSGIQLADSGQVTVIDSSIVRNKKTGIALKDRAGGTVKNCEIMGNDYGIGLWGSAEVTIEGSDIAGNEFGLVLADSSEASMVNCGITGNTLVGIVLRGSAQASLKNSTIRENATGIKIYKPEKFKGSLEGSGNDIADNEADFEDVPQSVREELLSS